MKMEKIIIGMLTLVVLVDGFEGEFRNPSPFDIVKWIAVIIMIICYIIGEKNGE